MRDYVLDEVIQCLGSWRSPAEKDEAQSIADRGMPSEFIVSVIREKREEDDSYGPEPRRTL